MLEDGQVGANDHCNEVKYICLAGYCRAVRERIRVASKRLDAVRALYNRCGSAVYTVGADYGKTEFGIKKKRQ